MRSCFLRRAVAAGALGLAASALGGSDAAAAVEPSPVATYRAADVVDNLAAGYGWTAWTVTTRGVLHDATKLVIRSDRGALRKVTLPTANQGIFDVDVLRGRSAGDAASRVAIIVDVLAVGGEKVTRLGFDPVTGKRSIAPWIAETHRYNQPAETEGIEDDHLITTAGSAQVSIGGLETAPRSISPTSCQAWSGQPGADATTELPPVPNCVSVSSVVVRWPFVAVTAVPQQVDDFGVSAQVQVLDLSRPGAGWISLGKSTFSKGGGTALAGPAFTPRGVVDLSITGGPDPYDTTHESSRPRTSAQLRRWSLGSDPSATSPQIVAPPSQTARLLQIADTGTRLVAIAETPVKHRGQARQWVRRVELLPRAWR